MTLFSTGVLHQDVAADYFRVGGSRRYEGIERILRLQLGQRFGG